MSASRKRRPRPYQKRKRALSEEATRRRITEAAVELHGSVGPARTTVTDVAERAGVTRMTVYKHFPSDRDLFVACSTHWGESNPWPNPDDWARVADPAERVSTALRALYGWYSAKEGMLGKVFRDEPTLPALADVMTSQWGPYLDVVVRTLAEGWTKRTPDDPELRAMLRVAVAFRTWTVLRDSGLTADRASEVAARMVAGDRRHSTGRGP